MLAIVPIDGGLFRIASLAYDGQNMYRLAGWYTIDGNAWVHDNARASVYRSANAAAVRVGLLNGNPTGEKPDDITHSMFGGVMLREHIHCKVRCSDLLRESKCEQVTQTIDGPRVGVRQWSQSVPN
jgi:hypothetical protein